MNSCEDSRMDHANRKSSPGRREKAVVDGRLDSRDPFVGTRKIVHDSMRRLLAEPESRMISNFTLDLF
jgi:hypothetical protein